MPRVPLLSAPHGEVVGQLRMGAVHDDVLADGAVGQGQLDEHVRPAVEPEVTELDGGRLAVHGTSSGARIVPSGP